MERRWECAEGPDERVVELRLGRGRRDDFELELAHDGRRRCEVVWEVVRTRPHDAHATREQREGQLGIAELKQVLNVALWKVDDHVIQLRQEGEGGSCLEQPRTVEDGGGVRLWMKRRVRRNDGFQQNIVFEWSVIVTEKGLILVNEGEVCCVGRQQPFFNGTGNVITTTSDVLPSPPL